MKNEKHNNGNLAVTDGFICNNNDDGTKWTVVNQTICWDDKYETTFCAMDENGDIWVKRTIGDMKLVSRLGSLSKVVKRYLYGK